MEPEHSDRTTSLGHWTPKHILFAALGLLTLFVLFKDERFIFDHSDPNWTYYFPVRWPLIPHGLAGAVALCLGASQFSTRLRQRHARVHRVLGRCYVAAVAISAPIGVYITMLHDALPEQVAVVTQASLWLTTTAVAYYCIRRRNFLLHRQWMIRSYAVTLIFVIVRLLDAIPGLADLDSDTSPNMIWLSNLIAWVVPTFIISWQDMTRSSPLKGPAASAHTV
jgi:uncharacterized membrane protein